MTMNRIKVINEPSELVPMLRSVDTPVKRDVLKEVTLEWRTADEIEQKFGPEGRDAIIFFEKMKLVETRWLSKDGGYPEKSYHTYYTSFSINAQWPVYEISDVLTAAMMSDAEYAGKGRKVLRRHRRVAGTFIDDAQEPGPQVREDGLPRTQNRTDPRRVIPMSDIWIMRIGHRPQRDKRVTTHVALSSRALGAKGIYVDTEDPVLEENIRSVVQRFGGDYTIKTGVSWKEAIRDFQGKVVHLTMYGQRVDEALPKIPRDEDIMIVVGAEKVPAEVYQRADFNVSVGNQPHSEIAALAIFLDRFTEGKALYADRGGELEVVPNERGKTVVEHHPE